MPIRKAKTEVCQTCRYWSGEISVTRTNTGELCYKTHCDKAICKNTASGFYGQERKNKNKCVKHDYR